MCNRYNQFLRKFIFLQIGEIKIEKPNLYISQWNGDELLKILKHYMNIDDFIPRLLGRYQNKIERKTKALCLFLCVFRQLILD